MKTWGQMKAEIFSDTNTEGEDFVDADDLLVWANDAKDEVEKEIVSIYDKYLETEDFLPLVEGEDTLDLPDDIYANKVTAFWYNDGSETYEIEKIRRKEQIYNTNSNDPYKYRFLNTTADGMKIKLHPAARVSEDEVAVLHYIRESAPLVDDDSLMDIPIAEGFIKQYIKDRIKNKEFGPAVTSARSEDLLMEKKLLIEALNEMTPDESSNELEMDTSAYDDFDDYGYGY